MSSSNSANNTSRNQQEAFAETSIAGKPAGYQIADWQQRFPYISAGITSRHGGISTGPLASMNCALHVQDEPQHVIANRAAFADTLGIPVEAWTCAEQVHGNRVALVTAQQRGRGRLTREDALQATDALITQEPGIWLTAFFADCVPLYFFDPEHKAVGLAHAGWKGTVLQIAEETVEAMTSAFGSRPERMLAAVGPSIGACCYEVDDAVAKPVREALERMEMAEQEIRFLVPDRERAGKYRLNLQQLNGQIMIKAGIMPIHIEICGLCTSCRTDAFYSHRKEHGRTGRMAAWIGIDLTSV
ncbi:peptidoglycan editing factor PgeF [Paenibacillus koleovorans]|uniref:peptidoglycan editing factor PgeF n=1 Tax=Paenibacillus koleovorans TaxID=121608 RepID=UPI000FDCA5EF|nr:peptidoglycan editing factor PgeF [Paenibacillus koleovorans]